MSRPATKRDPRLGTWVLALVSAALSAPSDAAAAGVSASQATETTYLGHHVVVGTVPVAIVGDVETRTDTWVLVTSSQTGDIMRWRQRTCRVAMAPVAGVKSSLPAETISKLPVADIRFDRSDDGLWHGGWDSQWTEDDLDGDGFPGVSIRVDVPLCSGYVYVAAQTHTQATANWVGGDLLGELHVSMRQRVLGASNLCLRLGPKQQRQTFVGVFHLKPMRNVTDCDGIAASDWPVAMQNPRSL